MRPDATNNRHSDFDENANISNTGVLENFGATNDIPKPIPTNSYDIDDSDNDSVDWSWDAIDKHVTLSSDTENDMDCADSMNLAEGLATWVNENQVKHNAVDSLLKLLKKHRHSDLPSTAHTLMKTKCTQKSYQAWNMYIWV